jgi:hypothetical protein
MRSLWLLLFALAVTLVSRPVFAFCRTTTCSVTGCLPRACLKDDAASDPVCAVACPPPRCLAVDSAGCLSKGIPLSWGQRCLSFSVESTGSPVLGLGYADLVPVVQKAFGLWPQALCDGGSPAVAIASLGALACDHPEYNPTGPNANGVIFQDQSWAHGSEVIGFTRVSFNASTGEITGADMEINTFDFGSEFTPEGLAYTIAHESGHFFGLAHTDVASALMFFQSSAGNPVAPVLTADDVAAICDVYPPSETPLVCDADPRAGASEPAHGFAPDCGGDVTAACAVPGPSSRRSSGTDAVGSIALGLALLSVAAGRSPGRRRRPR